MEDSQKNIRIMRYLGEFLDLDVSSFDSVAEFMALIQAIREGLTTIDDGFAVPDFHINLLLLSKLEAHPEWNEWARTMMQDRRLNASNPADRMKFHELASLAIQREKSMRQRAQVQQQTGGKEAARSQMRPQALTQEEINSFVVRQMRKDGQQQGRSHQHSKKEERISASHRRSML
ncbi:hypothetical protein VTN77DRAFT_1270 [Rasamsonia byssochlamydoides]|uniref:uncharacterized protein n=1 Tax=Rasamsonia byssochlamydoides TaxID=89139 RepID=UPI003744868C